MANTLFTAGTGPAGQDGTIGQDGIGLTIPVTQASHGFTIVGTPLYWTGTEYALAQADVDETCEVVGVVGAVAGEDNFTLALPGSIVTGSSGWTLGTVYYVSDVDAGELVTTSPDPFTNISKAIIRALTSSSFQVLNSPGIRMSGPEPVIDALTYTFGNGTDEITTGAKRHVYVPFDCTITGWTLLSDDGTTGSIVIDIWMVDYNDYMPTVSDSITASAKPTISSSIKGQSSTLTGWTTVIPAGSVLRFNVDSCTDLTAVALILTVSR
jgi:hypothetical protein